MSKLYDQIDSSLAKWIQRQKVFFVSTAPLSQDGHINCSPKGGDTFRIIDPHTVAYLDFTGSGIETVAHLRENKRILIMLCAFEGAPKIVRLHGKGEALFPGSREHDSLLTKFPSYKGSRSIIRVRVERISDSCGFGVPLMKFKSHRNDIKRWVEVRSPQEIAAYRRGKNKTSIDGLPGLDETWVTGVE